MKNAIRWPLLGCALMLGSAANAQVRISEIHYDDAGTDSGEAIEISSPAGTDLSAWTVVLYNGTGGASYGESSLAGLTPSVCGGRQVVVIRYPENGLQNGSPDGVALVDPSGAVVEFLSYEGAFTATAGAAVGRTSTDIGVAENGEVEGLSLARNAAGAWTGPAAHTFGACNDNRDLEQQVARVSVMPASVTVNRGATATLSATAFDSSNRPIAGVTFRWSSFNPAIAQVTTGGTVSGVAAGTTVITATAPNGLVGFTNVTVTEPAPADFHINEIHYDNFNADAGEAIEIEGPAGANLNGLTVVLYNGNGGVAYGTRPLSGTMPATCGARGVTVLDYPADGIQNGAPDGIALVSASGQVLEFVSYEGTFTAADGPAAGRVSVDIGVAQNSSPIGTSLQRNSLGIWAAGASSFGRCNAESPSPGNVIQFSGRMPSDVPLPVGFEDQLFARLVGAGNQTVPSTFTWVAETPDIATIDHNGVIRALAAGTATFRATAADGTTATWSLPTRVAEASTSAQYGNHIEFGEPRDADPADDLLIEWPQLVSSWNPLRGTPNWVAYEIDASHFGSEDRCDCFTMDPSLPSSLQRLTTADYTGAGEFHGYGIDRGHLARSFDRTAGSLDNARTFYFSNIIPQAADQNQGPWAQLENHLGDLARNQDREVYVLAGVIGNQGTLKNEGRVVIPTHTWKVALILPRDRGLADVRDYRDLEVVAVVMPNEPGIRNVPWQNYVQTVDQVEALSGYDLLALLEDDVEAAVESGTQPPIATIAGPMGAVSEGSTFSLSAAGSVDPNGSITEYRWELGDGSHATGVSVSHAYAQDGSYTVRLTTVDNDGLTDTVTLTVTVTNVAPTVGAVPDGSLNVGATYTVNGSFSDPGADSWIATVIWGDGSAPEVVPLADRSFTLTHIYAAAGSYPVTIRIADDDSATETGHQVTVNAPSSGLEVALSHVDHLVARGKITRNIGVLLRAQVIAAQVLLGRGNEAASDRVVRSILFQLDLLVRCRWASRADLAPLRATLLQQL